MLTVGFTAVVRFAEQAMHWTEDTQSLRTGAAPLQVTIEKRHFHREVIG